jgi:hypothetical protein
VAVTDKALTGEMGKLDMNRRGFLAVLVASLAGLSGWWFLTRDFEHRFSIGNSDDESHTAEVTITRGDTEIFNGRRTLDPGEDWTLSTVADRGSYTVSVILETGESLEETYDLPIKTNRRSYTEFTIDEDGSVESTVFWEQ